MIRNYSKSLKAVLMMTALLLLSACNGKVDLDLMESTAVIDNVVPVTGISLDKPSLELKVGDSETLTATVTPNNATNRSVLWTSSDPAVATVDQNGKVKAVGNGTATITATAKDGSGKSASCSVDVYKIPDAVNLGLSVKWASFNFGASSQEEYGRYYAWGETESKSDFNGSSYKWCNGSINTLTKYNNNDNYGSTVDNKTALEANDDVARVKLGGSWRMPTDADWTELRNNCTWTETTLNGVCGRLVTSKKNGASIFLPAAGGRNAIGFYDVGSHGYYWSSSLSTADSRKACGVSFDSDNIYKHFGSRSDGFSVRPVSK